jgi:hypothetical protein
MWSRRDGRNQSGTGGDQMERRLVAKMETARVR